MADSKLLIETLVKGGKKEVLVTFCFQFNEMSIQSDEYNEYRKSIRELIYVIYPHKQARQMPYDLITQYVYENIDNIDLNTETLEMLNSTEEEEKGNSELTDSVQWFVDKFIVHTNLALTQKKYIDDTIDDEIKKFQDVIDDTNEQIKIQKSEVEKMSDKAENITSEYIAILGIFSALIFGLFGGFSGVTDAMKSFAKNGSFGKAIFFISLSAILLLSLVYFLVYWIGLLIYRKSDNPNKRVFSKITDFFYGEESIMSKHKNFITLILVFLSFSLFGIIVYILQSIFVMNILFASISILILTVTILFVGCVIYKINNKTSKKSNQEN